MLSPIQLVKMTKTSAQYMSANICLPPQECFLSAQHIHVDKAIAKDILQKGTRGSFHYWAQDEYELAVTMLQKPQACFRWFRFDSECPCTNFCQGRYCSPIPEIGWILTLRGTTTLAPEPNSARPGLLACPAFDKF